MIIYDWVDLYVPLLQQHILTSLCDLRYFLNSVAIWHIILLWKWIAGEQTFVKSIMETVEVNSFQLWRPDSRLLRKRNGTNISDADVLYAKLALGSSRRKYQCFDQINGHSVPFVDRLSSYTNLEWTTCTVSGFVRSGSVLVRMKQNPVNHSTSVGWKMWPQFLGTADPVDSILWYFCLLQSFTNKPKETQF